MCINGSMCYSKDFAPCVSALCSLAASWRCVRIPINLQCSVSGLSLSLWPASSLSDGN